MESSTVGRSIVSKQEAHVCDLENKLEFSKGQVKRFEVRQLKVWRHPVAAPPLQPLHPHPLCSGFSRGSNN